MSDVPSNLIPTRLSQLPIAPVASADGYLPFVYQGVTYKVRAGDLLQVSGVPTTRQVIAGTGMQGGGALSSDVTLGIAPGGVGSSELDTTGAAAGTYGGPTRIPVFTVGSDGRIQAVSQVTPSFPGSGTVTSVSVISANGFGGTVADPTSTPAITLTTDLTGLLKGNGAAMQAAVEGTDYLAPAMTALGDMVYGGVSGVQTRLPGNTGASQLYLTMTGDGVNAGVPSWQPVSASGNLSFVFANVASDIGGYLQAVAPSAFTAGAAASVSATVTTTPTLIVTFATNAGFPNITTIPVGIGTLHWESTKAAGPNNYYTYAEVYKRTAGGTETLIATSDSSSSVAVNTLQNIVVSVLFTTAVSLNLTDRIVVKIYGVMLSSSASVSIRFDDNTDSLVNFPSVVVDASNFVPYTGATNNVNLGSKSLTVSNITSTGNATLGDAEASDTHAIKGATTLQANSASAALTVTQTGAGNVLVATRGGTLPTLAGTETGVFQWNGVAGHTSSVAIIGGASASAEVTFGDVNDVNIGYIRYENATDSLVIGTNNTERMRIDSAGKIGIGASPAASTVVNISNNITGATAVSGVISNGTVQSDVTAQTNYFNTSAATQATSFTLTDLRHYNATQGSIGATSTVTNQYGFGAQAGLTGATNNFGFYSNIASAANRYNFYAAGTAENYFAGVITGANIIQSQSVVNAKVATAIPAGGTQALGVSSTTTMGVYFGSGAPTVSAAKGSLYLRSDGSTTNDRMYVNTNGSTTWTAVITAT